MKMSWEYLAGFFDGEGNIRFGRGLQLSMAQGGPRGRALLEEIATFLASHGVSATVGLMKSRGDPHINVLWVTGREKVILVLCRLLPYLRIKEPTAQDTIRFCKMFPKIVSGQVLSMLIREARQRSTRRARR